MALTLLRKEGEWICLTDNDSGAVIWVGVELDSYFDEPRIRVTIDAPAQVHIRRGELAPKEHNAKRTKDQHEGRRARNWQAH